jgi:hypothetical protein
MVLNSHFRLRCLEFQRLVSINLFLTNDKGQGTKSVTRTSGIIQPYIRNYPGSNYIAYFSRKVNIVVSFSGTPDRTTIDGKFA